MRSLAAVAMVRLSTMTTGTRARREEPAPLEPKIDLRTRGETRVDGPQADLKDHGQCAGGQSYDTS